MGLLGSGSYDVIAQGRGGSPLLDILEWTQLSFQRRLDEVTTATVGCVAGSSPALAILESWEHEIAIVRDKTEAWVGPLVTPSWETQTVTLQANDVFFWMERRLLDQFDRDFVSVDAGTIFATLVQDALSRENSMGVVMAASSTGILATRTVLAAERRRAADVLRELARTAVDFTAIGRTVRCGGQEVPTDVSFTLVDETLRSPKLTSLGVDLATEPTVVGANVGNVPITGTVGSATDDLGLVQQSYSESTIQDSTSAEAAAQTRWDFVHRPPLSLSGVLAPSAPVDFGDLVPGARVRVELSNLDRLVADDFRLTQVDVSVQPSEQGLVEQVAVTLEPLGTVIG